MIIGVGFYSRTIQNISTFMKNDDNAVLEFTLNKIDDLCILYDIPLSI